MNYAQIDVVKWQAQGEMGAQSYGSVHEDR